MKKIIRTIVIFVVTIILAMFAYSMFFKKPSTSNSSLVTTSGSSSVADVSGSGQNQASVDADVASKQFLALLLNVQSITLDDSFFSSPGFRALKDFSQVIPPDTNPGRPNPFAPLGANSSVVSTQVSTGIPSLQTSTTANLNGTLSAVDPNATRWFEYGNTFSLGTTTNPIPQPKAGAFSQEISGLLPNTTYYVKAIANIGGQIVSGNLITWKTPLK